MPILVLRVGLSHEPVALAKIKVSYRGENDFLLLWIVLVVFSFYDVTALSNKRLVVPTLVLRVGLSHELVALTEIRISCRGENDLLPIALIVYSFCDVIALSSKRLVMPTLVLRVGLSHESVALANIKNFLPR